MTATESAPLLEVSNLHAGFGPVRVIEDVSLRLREKEIVGLIGESGSGKTTLGRLVLKMLEPDQGDITYRGRSINGLTGRALKDYRRQVQMVFQNPYGSLHPLQKIGRLLEEALEIHRMGDKASRRARVEELLKSVGLSHRDGNKRPSEFSGGQRQRIAIARALALGPDLMVADEPVSALDLSVQAQILNLLKDLNERQGLAILFISHDLSVVRFLCSRVFVMYLGTIVEEGPAHQVLARPAHPYTMALCESAPRIENAGSQAVIRPSIDGEVPGSANRPSGCPFHPRCALRHRVPDQELCKRDKPALRPRADGGSVACHYTDLLQGHAVSGERR